MDKLKKSKTLLTLIDDASVILSNSESFNEIIIKGDKTNIIITKPKKIR